MSAERAYIESRDFAQGIYDKPLLSKKLDLQCATCMTKKQMPMTAKNITVTKCILRFTFSDKPSESKHVTDFFGEPDAQALRAGLELGTF